ncbi:TetR family transcriptional regulator [Paenibacillus cisolokensis]|uniref:TetR family transcriptional regulator n=1 Tax=Paenibacillus cisolokensis TaxID=1658519 RepID=A0ABQ4NCI3_9BACL|nr:MULTISPECIES: TetR family transcriptional regulator [Paenibacillus]ALS28419.1 TetR family transcriptional regulator [Paenibacillus sp. 32O-W]GIQ65924.1 TetR family transcriptional regulator [Paenibacillus cisolokensis]
MSSDHDMKMRILLAAKKLFAQNGFDGTSVRQVCDEAGANVALVSYYFGGKENMLYAVFQTFIPFHLLHELEDILQHPVKGLKRLIREVIYVRMNDPEMIRIIMQEVYKSTPRIPHIQQMMLPVWFKLKELLVKGKEQGYFRYDSIDNTLFSVIGTIIFFKFTDYFKPLMSEPPSPYEEVVRDTTRFIFNALGASEWLEEEDS